MTTATLSIPQTVPMPVIWRFAATGLIAAFAVLLVFPYAVIELSRSGASPIAVGAFALFQPATMVLLILRLPKLQERIGRVASVRVGLTSALIAMVGFLVTDSYALWCLFSALIGVQMAIHWTSVDTAISENVPKPQAGRTIGLYQTLLAGAVAGGPAVVAISGVSFDVAVKVALALLLVAMLPTFGAAVKQIDEAAPRAKRKGGLVAFLRWNIPLAAVAILAGLFEVGTTAMGSVHALHLGFAAATALIVASVIAIGSLAAQVPIGWLADRFSPPTMMRLSGVILLLSAAALPFAAARPDLLWPLAALWGAFGGALQTLVYMYVAVTKKGIEVQLGMITMALGFTFGSLIGPGLGGMAKELSADHGLTILLATTSAAVLGLVWSKRAFPYTPGGR